MDEEDGLISRLSLDSNNSGSSKVRVKAAGDNQFTFELNEDTECSEMEVEEEEEDEEDKDDGSRFLPCANSHREAALIAVL